MLEIAVWRADELARERLAFPFGEGGPLAVEEVLPQYEFAAGFPEFSSAYRTSPAPFGGNLPRGEGFYPNQTVACLLDLSKFVILELQLIAHIDAKGQQGDGDFGDHAGVVILDEGVVATDVDNGTIHIEYLCKM